MKQLFKRICCAMYRITGCLLPDSYFAIKIGKKKFRIKIGFWWRGFLVRHYIDKCGKEVNIEKKAIFGQHIELGDYSGIGKNCHIANQTIIGSHVMMGPEVVIFTRNHKFDSVDISMDKQGFQPIRPVHVGNDVWIGQRAMILPGVTIGDGCIIGAGAVVSKDTPPYSVVVGNPARVVKKRIKKE